MKRTYSKFAAQPEHGKLAPKPKAACAAPLTTAERVRLSLLIGPRR